jgi:hypothetical protein
MVHNKEGSSELSRSPFYSGWLERHRATIAEGKAALEAAAVPASLESLLANRPGALKCSDQEEAWVRILVDRLASQPDSSVTQKNPEEFLILHPLPAWSPVVEAVHSERPQTPPQSQSPLLLPDASPSAGDQLSEPPAR